MASKAQYIIGVDTGGTFTDVVVLSNAGEVWTAKASTTPDDFSRGVMDAVDEAHGLPVSRRRNCSATPHSLNMAARSPPMLSSLTAASKWDS